MLVINESTAFRRDVKKAIKRGKDIAKLYAVVKTIALGEGLPSRCRPHRLSGNWAPCWECHIEPDWVLIYETSATELVLTRTGTHSDFF